MLVWFSVTDCELHRDANGILEHFLLAWLCGCRPVRDTDLLSGQHFETIQMEVGDRGESAMDISTR